MARQRRLRPGQPDNPDARVVRMGADAENVLSIKELRQCGLSANAVSARVRRGWLVPVHEGVYSVGRAQLTLLGRFIAAVKACGERAALSHRSCVVYMGMLEWREQLIDVTVRSEGTRLHEGIRVHRSKLERSDLWFRDGMWVVRPEWALLGLASQAGAAELRAAVRRGYANDLVSPRSLAALLGQAGPVRGSRKLADVLAEGLNPTRTVLEDIVLDLILGAGFEAPDVNQRLEVDSHVFYPDFRWPDQRLIVEADSRAWHEDPVARAADAERQAILEAHGERFVRVSWSQSTVGRAQTIQRIMRAGAPTRER